MVDNGVVEGRAEHAVLVEDAGAPHQVDARHGARLHAYRLWTPAGPELDTPLERLLDLPLKGGHLLTRLEASHNDLAGSVGSGGHGAVTATLPPPTTRPYHLALACLESGFAKVLEPRDGLLLALDPDLWVYPGSGGYDNRIRFGPELVKRDIAPHLDTEAKLHAELLVQAEHLAHHITIQPERRDAETQHAAAYRLAVDHRHAMALPAQIEGGGEPGRTGSRRR